MGPDAIPVTSPEVSDTELMHRLAGGDDLALNLIIERWSSRVAAFLYRRTGQQDVATDLAQETFVKLYQARLRYHPSGIFSTYLFAIAANLARNHTRWVQRHPTVSLDEPTTTDTPSHDPRDPHPSPDKEAVSAETCSAVHAAFQTLPDDLREAITLFIYEDLSYAEIARIAGCSSKAVETRIYRARQMLKETLASNVSHH